MNTRRRLITLTTVAALCLVQCSATDLGIESVEGGVSTVVYSSGLDVTVGGITVTSGAGVATPGTEVVVTIDNSAPPGEWASFSRPLADAVTIQLGNGEQPSAPITIDFNGVEAADDVFVVSKSDGQIDVLEHLDTGPLTVQTDHLSTFWAVVVSVADFSDSVFSAAMESLQIKSTAPGCFRDDGVYQEFGLEIGPVRGDTVWPCLSPAGTGVELELFSNSSVAWLATTDPRSSERSPLALTAADVAAQASWRSMDPSAADGVLLLPMATVGFYPSATRDTTVTLTVDPVVSQVRALAAGLNAILPDRKVELIGKYDCVADILDSRLLADTNDSQSIGAFLRCVGSSVGGKAGFMIGLLAAAPAALWTQLEGVMRAAFRLDEVSFEIEAGTRVVAPRTSQPISLTDIEPWLGTWSGPVDQQGSEPYSVNLTLRHNSTTVIGTVEYPELSCSGVLDDAVLRGSDLTITETITEGSRCVASLPLDLHLYGDNIRYSFDVGIVGYGVLSRR